MTITQTLVGVLFVILTITSCDQEQEKIPSYIYIDKFSFIANQGEGTAHQNLTDGWIYINHRYYGAYELPAWIPVLEEGPSQITIYPGYRLNGMITNTAIYALLNADTISINLTPRLTDTLKPKTGYQEGLQFSIVDFDGRHFFNKDRDNDIDTKIILSSPADAYEGSNSGLIELTSSHPSIFTEDDLNNLVIPPSVDPIILELNFKSDIPFSIGFIGFKTFSNEDVQLDAALLPKKEWTKVYFDFRTILNLSNSDYYHLAINANYDATNSLATQRILIDNIKVIHR